LARNPPPSAAWDGLWVFGCKGFWFTPNILPPPITSSIPKTRIETTEFAAFRIFSVFYEWQFFLFLAILNTLAA
jgi:hypothetical protein